MFGRAVVGARAAVLAGVAGHAAFAAWPAVFAGAAVVVAAALAGADAICVGAGVGVAICTGAACEGCGALTPNKRCTPCFVTKPNCILFGSGSAGLGLAAEVALNSCFTCNAAAGICSCFTCSAAGTCWG